MDVCLGGSVRIVQGDIIHSNTSQYYCTYMLYLCQFGMKIGTGLGASVRVGMDVCSCACVFCVRGQHGFLQYFTILCIGSFIGSPTGWCIPSPCVQGSNTTCSSDFITPATSMWVLGLCVHVCCMCIGGGDVCVYICA